MWERDSSPARAKREQLPLLHWPEILLAAFLPKKQESERLLSRNTLRTRRDSRVFPRQSVFFRVTATGSSLAQETFVACSDTDVL
jgi:hypothetical protein